LTELDDILNALPFPALIIDDNNKILFSNNVLLSGEIDVPFNTIVGNSIGSFLRCENADKKTGACNHKNKCNFCGIPSVIEKSKLENKKASGEAVLISQTNNHKLTFDISITASPIHNPDNNKQVLVVFSDISQEKRKKALERIFFHDIINHIGSLNGILSIIKSEKKDDHLEELFNITTYISKEIEEEILQQRQLTKAENNELTITLSDNNTLELIKSSIEQTKFISEANNKYIEIDSQTEEVTIQTDPVILKRILINLLKNALEASETDETVIIGCAYLKNNAVRFMVKNNKVISKENKQLIFRRRFSTKGDNRGLGTYSVKLLGERYLKGKVDFISNDKEGTIFYIELPVNSRWK